MLGAMIPARLPIVQIRQTYALIGIDADLGKQSIRQPRPTYEMKTERPKQFIRQPKGELYIDSTRAWDALGLGGTLEMLRRIYDQGHKIALETIGKIAAEGDRLAAIHTGENAIAINAMDNQFTFAQYQYAGPASFDNVDITYIAHRPIIEVEEGKIHVNARVNPVEHEYRRGKLEIYLRQRNSIRFIPPDPPTPGFSGSYGTAQGVKTDVKSGINVRV